MRAPWPPVPPLPPIPWIGTSDAVPVGTVLTFAGDVNQQATPLAARGYLVCDGSKLSVSQFYELFLALGYQYSPCSGGEFFNLPDLQGYFLRGIDPRGQTDPDTSERTLVNGTTSAGVGSRQTSAFQLHEHDYTPGAPSGVTATGTGGNVGTGTATTSAVVGSGQFAPLTSAQETRPINTAVYHVIKYTSACSPAHLPVLWGVTVHGG